MKRIIVSIGLVLVCSVAFCQQHEPEKPLSELTGETSTQQEILAKSPAETLSDLLGEKNEDGNVIVEEVK